MNPAHDAMAEHATQQQAPSGLARLVDGLPHCSDPCNGGREACTCATGRVLRAGPAPRDLITRLRRWWAAGKLRAEIAGIDADLAENELAQVGIEHSLRRADEPYASAYRGRLELLRCEVRHLNRRRDETERRLADLGSKP